MVPKQTIGALVDERACRDGVGEALVFQGRRWSFAELPRDRAARGLLHLGIEPGDKVALWMVNRPEWIHAALAVMRIGAVLRESGDLTVVRVNGFVIGSDVDLRVDDQHGVLPL